MSSQAINRELSRMQADALVTMYVLDATEIGGDLLFFYPGFTIEGMTDLPVDNELNVDVDAVDGWSYGFAPLTWQGIQYTSIPMEARGFEFKGEGSPPRPSLIFGNVAGMFSGLVLAFDDLIGARLIRKRTFARYLDGQPGADPTQALPDDIFYFERKVTENKFAIEFELGTSMDIDDTALPARMINANLCSWIYRGEGCGYVGEPKADVFDMPPGVTLSPRGQWSADAVYHVGDYVWRTTPRGHRRYAWCFFDNAGAGVTGIGASPANGTFWKADECSKRLRGCEHRFGTVNLGLPFGGFPSTTRRAG